MRRPLFIAMIFLLLLRGMVGDAMATGMAAGHLQRVGFATESTADFAHDTRANQHFNHARAAEQADFLVHTAAIPADCAGHGAGLTSDPIAPEAAAHCESCSACQACHTVALSPLVAQTDSFYKPPALAHAPADQFASAVAALGQKPPIS
jgi:hypothetical protein